MHRFTGWIMEQVSAIVALYLLIDQLSRIALFQEMDGKHGSGFYSEIEGWST